MARNHPLLDTPMDTTNLEFPCDFPVKVIGLNNDNFERSVLGTISKYFANLKEGALEYRPSKDKKFLSITVTVLATDKATLDALYRELSVNPHVLMAM